MALALIHRYLSTLTSIQDSRGDSLSQISPTRADRAGGRSASASPRQPNRTTRRSAVLHDALTADKSLHTSCRHCGKRFPVEVPDWAARDKVVNTMLTQGFGRPAAGAGGLTVIRRLVLPDG